MKGGKLRDSGRNGMNARAAFASGASEAFGVPAGVLAAGYLGFGALAGAHDLSLWFTLISTLTIWALPGQLLLLDLWQIAAPMTAVVSAAMIINARFLPMTMTLMPVLQHRGYARWRYYLAAHVVAMSAWAICVRRCPEMPRPERLPFFTGFGLTCVLSSTASAAVGYAIAGEIPQSIQVGLVFLTPIYFFVILIGDVRARVTALALACGGLAGPLFHLVTPQWGALLAGVVGGSAAFVISRVTERSHA